MLPPLYRDYYRSLRESLEFLETEVLAKDLVADTTVSSLRAGYSSLQQKFQLLLHPTGETLGSELENRIRVYNTEIHKQLRLLSTDLMFLQTARLPNSQQKRLTQIGDRLQALIGYCDALLSDRKSESESDAPQD